MNYVIKSFKIKNIGSGELVISGGYVKSDVTDTAIGIVDTTGGTIFLAPDHVVGINVTGSDIEPSDIAEAVWDRLTINNQQSGTFGKLMQDISANVDDAIVTNFV